MSILRKQRLRKTIALSLSACLVAALLPWTVFAQTPGPDYSGAAEGTAAAPDSTDPDPSTDPAPDTTDPDPTTTEPEPTTDPAPTTTEPEPTTDPAPTTTETNPTTDPAPTTTETNPGTDSVRAADLTPSDSSPSGSGATDTGTAQRSAAGGPRVIAAQAAQSSVLLGTAESVAVLGGSAVTNTGPSVISGDVDVAPACAVSGFPPGIVINGTIHRCDAVAAQAQADLTTAYNDAAGRIPTGQVATELGGQTLTTGVYDSASGTFEITGALTLDAQGDPDAVFIFQTESTLITASASRVVLINGAQACNVFWQIGSSATLGTNSSFAGNILALTSITATTGATVDGRLLARNGAVTLDTNTITASECAITVPVPDNGNPTDGGDTGGDDDTTGGDTTGGDDDTTGSGDDGDGTGGDDSNTGGGNTTIATGGDDSNTGGGNTTIGTGGGDDITTGDGEGGRMTQLDQSSDLSQRTLPFTGLDIGILALLGGVMLLLGTGLRKGAAGQRPQSATIDELETSTSGA